MMQIGRTLTPMLFSLAVTQINTFTDSMIAWGLAAAPDGPQADSLARRGSSLPAQQGAAAAISYGERMYQFPLGIVGMAVAASIFPLLSRHAAHGASRPPGGRPDAGAAAGAVPERAGRRGTDRAGPSGGETAFPDTATSPPLDTARAAGMIAAYALGVWAYCASPVMVRGFYALGDCATPVRVGGRRGRLEPGLEPRR